MKTKLTLNFSWDGFNDRFTTYEGAWTPNINKLLQDK